MARTPKPGASGRHYAAQLLEGWNTEVAGKYSWASVGNFHSIPSQSIQVNIFNQFFRSWIVKKLRWQNSAVPLATRFWKIGGARAQTFIVSAAAIPSFSPWDYLLCLTSRSLTDWWINLNSLCPPRFRHFGFHKESRPTVGNAPSRCKAII